ncbi:hypothetical protein [Methylomonas sp. AM2-LC]|uniref:hypothetical protein n=1 Tax=Methylomonas sp. AM2-LC TaxID=3153301 RepID=UPI003265C880
MAEESNSKSDFSLAHVTYLLLIVVAGGLFVEQDSFHETRPNQNQTHWGLSNHFQDIAVRLWQDPFEALNHHKTPKLELVNNEDASLVLKNESSNEEMHDLQWFNEHLREKFQNNSNSIIMAVMLPGGPYYEDSETRRRLRYAVLSGFNAALAYEPEDSEHIGVFRWYEPNIEISYEMLAETPKLDATESKQAIVLYLNSQDFQSKPYEKLNKLFVNLASNCNPNKHCEISLLGPTDSAMLLELASETMDMETWHPPLLAANFRIYSPRATIDEKSLFQDTTLNDDPISANFNRIGLNFNRVTATDKDLAKRLSAELALRGIQISDASQHIVLISENDTLYGHHIGTTFAQQLAQCNDITPQVCQQRLNQIHKFSYFRGLDGEKPNKTAQGTRTQHTEGASNEGNNDKEAQSKAMESADGDSQFDYVRRLVEKLEALNTDLATKQASITAIGVLGSDVYDKLLILEAFHESFPQALFFSNEMDARILHPDQNQWTRNLIVTSSLGLELAEQWQKDIPPFRDSYQTGYFLATEMALWDAFHAPVLTSSIYKQTVIHEIGRTRAFNLPDNRHANQDMPDINDSDSQTIPAPLQIPSPYDSAIQEAEYPTLPAAKHILAIASIGLLVLFILWRYFSHQLQSDESYPLKYQLRKVQRQISLGLFAGAFVLISALLAVWYIQPAWYPAEPIAWLEGVSIWPTLLIRYIAIVVAVNGIVAAYHWPDVIKEQLFHKLSIKLDNSIDFNFKYEFLENAIQRYPACKSYLDYSYKGFSVYTLLGMTINILIIATFSIILIKGFGSLNIPFRGELSFDINALMMMVLLITFILALVLVITRTQTIIRYIEDNIETAPRHIHLLKFCCQQFSQQLNIPATQLSEWAKIRLISELAVEVNQLIFYPLIVVALHVFSRMSYFDHWNTPPGLLLALALCFGYLFYCDFRLKSVAEEAEKETIKKMKRRLMRSDGRQDSALSTQLKTLIERAEIYAALAYKPFLQRPIFQGFMLIIAATAIGYSDYASLMTKFLK